MTLKSLILLVFVSFSISYANAQCISTFPYIENFETSAGNWVSGGNGNTWAWGTPNKTYINSAGAGTKCWVTDGLTGTGYANCERSWIESPCFDFTNVSNPVVAMKIYWECENNFDGCTFQYTLNNGSTWVNVGAAGDPINCLNGNWFNNNNITHLGSSGGCTQVLATTKHGWCGTSLPSSGACQGGSGSLGWLVAKHCLNGTGGQPNVKFRFAFGAGSNCNNYDGFAFDSVAIFNAAGQVTSGFTWSCGGANNILFTNTTANTNNCVATYAWNFGDPTSGGNNTSTLQNPQHNYSAAGTYTTTLTATNPCNVTSTYTQVVKVLSLSTSTVNPTCNGANNGTITALSSNSTGSVIYSINPVNITNTTGVFGNLNGGSYNITATDAIGCSKTINVSISNPPALSLSFGGSSTPLLCGGANNGLIDANGAGGTGTLSYTLTPNNTTNTTGLFISLAANIYTIAVSDANGCSTTKSFEIKISPSIITNPTKIEPDCEGQNGSIYSNSNGGTGSLIFNLQPSNQNNTIGNFLVNGANTYTITIKDANNCSVSTTILFNTPNALNIVNVLKKELNCPGDVNGNIVATASGGTGALSYALNPGFAPQGNGTFTPLAAGNYTVIVNDSKNCTSTQSFSINLLSTAMSAVMTKSDVGCVGLNNDGSAAINLSGGTAPYKLTWNTVPPQTTTAINNLYAGTYYCVVYDANNCLYFDSAKVAPAVCCKAIEFADVFTPNKDFVNDDFGPTTFINYELVSFEIFNRFGQSVFLTRDKGVRWDGFFKERNCDLGTYWYIFRYKCLEDNVEYSINGDVLLHR
jgi:gliding motility-associated-like protein